MFFRFTSKSNTNWQLSLSCIVAALGVMLTPALQAQDTAWVGGTAGFLQDWNTASNWTAGVPIEDGGADQTYINVAAGNFPRITAAGTYSTDWDLRIGEGLNGRLDQLAGTLNVGNGNYIFLGYQGATATYNLANTGAGGGASTGFGTGSGSLNVGGANLANLLIGLDAGTTSVFNMNTTGVLSANYIELGGSNSSGTFNLDAGTVNVGGVTSVGHGGGFDQTQTGIFNMTGGTYNSGGIFRVGFAGSSGATATANISGGNLNVGTVANDSKLVLGKFDGMNATLNVTGSGIVNLMNGADLVPAFEGNNTGTRTYNVNGGQILGSAGSSVDFGWPGGSNILRIQGGGVVAIQNIFGGGASNKTVEFDGGTLRALNSDLGFINFFGSGVEGIDVKAGGGTLDSQGYVIEIQENATGAGGLTKVGTGTLYVGPVADFSYAGATNINEGAFRLGGKIAQGVNVASGATLSASKTTFETNFSTIGGALTMASGSTLTSTLVDPLSANTPPAISAGSVDFTTIGGSVAVVVYGAENLAAGVPVTVLSTTGAVTNLTNLKSTYRGGTIAKVGNNIQLTLPSLNFQTKTWNTNSGTWNVGSAATWTAGGGDNFFYNGDTVTFGASTGTRTITLSGLLQPKQVTVNSAGDYVFTGGGSITDFDNTMLTKSGAGSLTLATANSHEGGTVLNAGTLNVNHMGALGISSVIDTDALNGGRLANATLTINGGKLDNTSGSPIKLGYPVNQTWAGSFSTGAGDLDFNGGSVAVNGTATATLGTGALTVGSLPIGTSGTATLNVNGVGNLFTQGLTVGGGNGTGMLNVGANVTANGVTIAASGGGEDSIAKLTVQGGGQLTSTGTFVVGRGGDGNVATPELVIDAGGVVNVGFGMLQGQFDAIDSTTTVRGTLNLTDGSDIVTAPGDFFGGFVNTGTRTITVDGGLIQGGAGSFIDFGYDGSGSNVLNIQNGGEVAVQAIFGGGGTNKTINFDNGTLRPVTDDGGFVSFFGGGVEQLNVLSGGATFDTDGFNATLQDALLGSGDVTKQGAGNLTLTGDNSTYTGDTIVQVGQLTIDPASDTGWFDNGSAVQIGGSAILDLQFTGSDTVRYLYLNGVPQSPSTYGSGNSGGLISGTGSLTVLELGPQLGLPGDYNGDNKVDAADYAVWRNGNSPDHTINGYNLWRDNYGATLSPPAASNPATAPEPGSLVLLLGLAASGLVSRRRLVRFVAAV